MAKVQVRLNSVQQKPNGTYQVDAVLPDGTFYVGEVAASLNREDIALALAGVASNRSLNSLTGLVEIEEEKWDAAVAAAQAKAQPAEAAAPAVAETGKAEKASK